MYSVVNKQNCQVTKPAVNVVENENEYQVALVVAGYEKNDIKIKVENNNLVVKAEAKEAEKAKYLRKEFNTNGFERSFILPESTEVDKISAEHKNGVLYVNIPKKEKVEIKIKDIEVSN